MNDVELQHAFSKLAADCGLPTEQVLQALFVAADEIALRHCLIANNGRLNGDFITVDDVLAVAKQGANEIREEHAAAIISNCNMRILLAPQPRN